MAKQANSGLGDSATPGKHLWFQQNACKLNSPRACAVVGRALRKGQGAPVDTAGGIQADRTGCRLKMWASCERLLRDELARSTSMTSQIDSLRKMTCGYMGREHCLRRGREFLSVRQPLTDSLGELLLETNCLQLSLIHI